eukprot:Phypoly_transcript_17552.p1 GENE.Phypoly_transcript_17552~~Phypoly_transcript_17552.p1  ORF type:complete len:152 (+),score=15.86 Phypoly_transcript_17552:214-669(+)
MGGGMMKRAGNYTIAFSCNSDDTGSNAYGIIEVKYTIGGTAYESNVCNTYQCKSSSSRSAVTAWLNSVPVGTNLNCTYPTSNPKNVMVNLDNICEDHGKYNPGTNSCTCDAIYTGETCDQYSDDDNNRPNSGSSLFVSCFFAVAALCALVM